MPMDTPLTLVHAGRPPPGKDGRVDLRVGEDPLLGAGEASGGAQLVSLSVGDPRLVE